ncbi:hemin uptake protein HemP [Salmonella enterica]|nr:hemin uptake protein HemP [Salmonella enterica]EJJ4248012.1 hemin uptake protein HemP [Salmonella enterica]ELM1617895.1 hemin uptake protein HemP [Salmonella enterica]QKT16967.1 hemin uptake protein HemP [Salmonella enterica]HCL4433956.1 hemin uptake protein HemP [Salmonella enterica]
MIIIIVIIFITDQPDMHNTLAATKNANAPLSPTRTKRQIDSRTLLGEEGWALIEHNGQHYLLRQTQSGKLILTK